MQPSVSHQIVHYRSPEEQFHSFSTIGEEELYKLVKSAKPTTCMLDPIPSKLLKEVLPEVIDPHLAIINSSLSLGYVLKKNQMAVIKPLIKKTQLDPKDLVNYIPISNLHFLSKILEKVVSSQLYSFLEKNDICEDFQSGFRPSHSSETAPCNAFVEKKDTHTHTHTKCNHKFLRLNPKGTAVSPAIPTRFF